MSCSLLKGRETDGFPVYQEKFIRECIRKFPYCDITLLQQLVRSIAPVEIVSPDERGRKKTTCYYSQSFVFDSESLSVNLNPSSSQGNDPTALSVLTQAITGQVGFMDAEFCISCGEKGAEKRCSACKMVSEFYFLHVKSVLSFKTEIILHLRKVHFFS